MGVAARDAGDRCAIDDEEALGAAHRELVVGAVQVAVDTDPDAGALQDEAERRLASRITILNSQVTTLLQVQDYGAALRTLAGLRDDVDAFFDGVMVMAENPELRRNRLALLQAVEALFLKVADISLLK